jgi:phage terminase small subunit
MGVPKQLTEMQRKFAETLVFGDKDGKPVTKTEAARIAGFSPNRLSQEGYELTNPKIHPLVVDYIGKLREEKIQKYMVTFDGHLAELDRIKEKALKKNSFSTAGNMEIARGKAAGLYIDRKIIKTGKLEDMSEQELENKMRQILDDYAPLLNAKTIDGKAEVISSESSLPNDEESLYDPQT